MTDLVIGGRSTRRWRTQEEFLELMQSRGERRARRGRARGRGGVRRRLEVPGAGQVRAARLDGVQGRGGAGRRGRTADDAGEDDMTEQPPTARVARRHHRGDARRRRPRARHQRRRPRPGLRRHRSTRTSVAVLDMTLTSAACPLTDVIEDQTRVRARAAWSPTSGSTGSGCRRGARTRSPTTAASSCAPSASTSERPPRPGRRACPATSTTARPGGRVLRAAPARPAHRRPDPAALRVPVPS